jgi:hypothetical protein
MGDGRYRAHFFGDANLVGLGPAAFKDQLRYSAPALRRRLGRSHLATQTRV